MYWYILFHITFTGCACIQILRYNVLLDTICTSLVELEKGIKGLVVMSSDLEEVFTCIHNAQVCISNFLIFIVVVFHTVYPLNVSKVPPLWSKAFPSLKPLGAWTRDLIGRVEQFSTWATTTHPPVLFWLSGFTFPTGFLTAVLQTAARKNNVRTQNHCLLIHFLLQIGTKIINSCVTEYLHY